VADITSFKIQNNTGVPATYANGVFDGDNITVTLPYDFYQTNVTSLTPVLDAPEGVDVTYWNGSAWVAPPATANFTDPVQYKATSTGGSEIYTVTVITDAASKTNAITSFKIGDAVGSINGTNIAVVVPYSTNLASLDAKIVMNGVKLEKSVNGGGAWTDVQTTATPDAISDNGVDFSTAIPVQYRVTAQDASMLPADRVKTYIVTVTKSPVKNTNDITKFSIGTAVGAIDQAKQTISVLVPFSQDLTALPAPVVEHNGKSYSVGAATTSATTATYDVTVTAENTVTKTYAVTVTKDDPTKTNSITSFVINKVVGEITEATGVNSATNRAVIKVVLPYDATLGSLNVDLKHNGASFTGSVSNVNFTASVANPVEYSVTSQDGKTKYYKATVTKAAPTSTKDITSFAINGVEGVISGQNITVTLPYGSDVKGLVPVIEHTGASIDPDPETSQPQSFLNPVLYTVEAENASTKIYTVTVTTAPATKEITSFKIGDIVGTIGDGTVAIEVPFGTDVTALAPTIVHNGASITPASGIAQNFTSPVTYKVTAQDSSTNTKDYVVTVTVASDKPAPPATITGWDYSTGVWKYIKADGTAQTGWFYDSAKYKSWFYFASNGNMVSSQWYHDTAKDQWFYLTGNGKMAIGTYTINGKTQSFAGNGVWKG
jgi:hypothetical protein